MQSGDRTYYYTHLVLTMARRNVNNKKLYRSVIFFVVQVNNCDCIVWVVTHSVSVTVVNCTLYACSVATSRDNVFTKNEIKSQKEIWRQSILSVASPDGVSWKNSMGLVETCLNCSLATLYAIINFGIDRSYINMYILRNVCLHIWQCRSDASNCIPSRIRHDWSYLAATLSVPQYSVSKTIASYDSIINTAETKVISTQM